MDPESDDNDPGRRYAKSLKEKIVEDAADRDSAWTGRCLPRTARCR